MMIFKTWYDELSDDEESVIICPIFSSIITWSIWLCILSTYLNFNYAAHPLSVIGGLAIAVAITIFIGYIWFNLAKARRELKNTIFGNILEFICFVLFSIITGLYISIPLYLVYLIGKFIFYIIPKGLIKLVTKSESNTKTDKPHTFLYNKETKEYEKHYYTKDELFNKKLNDLIDDLHYIGK